jgi:hypothetical protein
MKVGAPLFASFKAVTKLLAAEMRQWEDAGIRTQGRGTLIGVAQAGSEAWATLYNRVGVVKRHLNPRRVLTYLFVERF